MKIGGLEIGPPKPVVMPKEGGAIGGKQPCWVAAIKLGGEDYKPFATFHYCDRPTATACAIAVAAALSLHEILLGEIDTCNHTHGQEMKVLDPSLLVATPKHSD